MKQDLRQAVFLDRDGVLNRVVERNKRPYPPTSLSELEIFPDARQALESLAQAKFLPICVTNQPDVARGTLRKEVVETINAALLEVLPLCEIMVCYHDDKDSCECRKPKPGMLVQAAKKYQIDLQHSFMVGDRWKDIEAGRRAGCKTALIDYGYDETGVNTVPDCRVRSLSEAVEWILGQLDQKQEESGEHPVNIKS